MPAETKRYFAIAFEHDRDPLSGALPPAAPLGINVVRPVMVNGAPDLVPVGETVQPIEGTRIYETDDALIAKALEECPESLLIEIEKPSAKALKEQRDQTAEYLAAKAGATNTDTPEA